MIEELEKDMYLSTDTKVFVLVELEDFDQQSFFRNIQPSWNRSGYELTKSIVPPRAKFKDGTFDFRLEFASDMLVPLRAQYYGLTNALKKGRTLKEPFLIISPDSHLRKPIPKEWVNQVEKFHTLSKRRVAKDGIIVTPQAASELVTYLVSNTLDQSFSDLYNNVLIPTFNANVLPADDFTEKR